MSRRHAALAALLVWAVLAGLLAACGSGESSPAATATPLPGTVLNPPKPLGEVALTAHTGQPFKLSDLRGQVVLIYFGYTNCPDVCPMTLASYKRAKALLGDDAERLAVLFISVDGARDTPERLAQYVPAFDPTFIGATGDEVTIRTIARDFGVFFQRVNYENETNYLVDHTASTFVVGPQGDLNIIYPYGVDPQVIADGVRALLKDSP